MMSGKTAIIDFKDSSSKQERVVIDNLMARCKKLVERPESKNFTLTFPDGKTSDLWAVAFGHFDLSQYKEN